MRNLYLYTFVEGFQNQKSRIENEAKRTYAHNNCLPQQVNQNLS